MILRSSAGGECNAASLNITNSGTFTCKLSINSNNCQNDINSYITSSFQVCLNGNCSSLNPSQTIISSVISGTNCNNVITGVSINLKIKSSGS